MKKQRIELIDAARGLAVILMVIHHLLYDLVAFLNAPEWLFSNPVFNLLHYFFAGLFIFLSGISSNFSRSNVKRGIKVVALALGISVVTYFIDAPIRFGVLHLLGFSMVFYGLTRRLWDGIPRKAAPFIYLALLVGSALAVRFIVIDFEHIWMFGWTVAGFVSYDYFPIFPWLFVFLAGTWAGHYVLEEKLPRRFYEQKVPVLPAVGRKALIIYILHQPVMYGSVMLILKLFPPTR